MIVDDARNPPRYCLDFTETSPSITSENAGKFFSAKILQFERRPAAATMAPEPGILFLADFALALGSAYIGKCQPGCIQKLHTVN